MDASPTEYCLVAASTVATSEPAVCALGKISQVKRWRANVVPLSQSDGERDMSSNTVVCSMQMSARSCPEADCGSSNILPCNTSPITSAFVEVALSCPSSDMALQGAK